MIKANSMRDNQPKEIEIHAKEIKLIDPKTIKLNPRNYNTHPESQIESLAKGIEYYGFRDPVVVSNLNGITPEGEGRILASIKLGMPLIPVMFQDFSSEDLQAQYGLFHNGIAKQSEIDLSKVNADIVNWGPELDFDMLGLKDFVLEPADKYGDKDADATPDVRETSIRMGDLFQLGQHRLLCGDSTDKAQVERLMSYYQCDCGERHEI